MLLNTFGIVWPDLFESFKCWLYMCYVCFECFCSANPGGVKETTHVEGFILSVHEGVLRFSMFLLQAPS